MKLMCNFKQNVTLCWLCEKFYLSGDVISLVSMDL